MSAEKNPLENGFLFTDQYQLTMAQLYFRLGFHEQQVQFDHFYRRNPDYGNSKAGYCINTGLAPFVEWLQQTRAQPADIEALRSQTTPNGERVFQDDFLEWLSANGNYDSISMRSIPEGRVIHPNVPLAVIQGPLAICRQ